MLQNKRSAWQVQAVVDNTELIAIQSVGGTYHNFEAGGIVFALLLTALGQEVVELEGVLVPLDGVNVLALGVVLAVEGHLTAEYDRARNLNLRDTDTENNWNEEQPSQYQSVRQTNHP